MAAEIGLAGMNPYTYLREKDGHVRAAMEHVARLSRDRRDHYDEQLAVRIANAVGKLLGG